MCFSERFVHTAFYNRRNVDGVERSDDFSRRFMEEFYLIFKTERPSSSQARDISGFLEGRLVYNSVSLTVLV